MRRTITVVVDGSCGEAMPSQLASHLDEIVERIVEAAHREDYEPYNKVLNISWDEPRAVELEVSVDVSKDE